MLRHLSIRNYAIIDRLEIDFDDHLNIITGETGAGKSIILGALHMLLGKRADKSVLRDEGSKAVIEGTFHVGHLKLKAVYKTNDLDYDEETIIRREIRPNGKSRAFVNDSPVTLDQLRALTIRLVDLHTQQDNSAVLDKHFFTHLLDRLAGQDKAVSGFTTQYCAYRELDARIHALKARLASDQGDLDYLEFQLDELKSLALSTESDSDLEGELAVLEHAGLIIETMESVEAAVSGGDTTALDALTTTVDKLSGLVEFNADIAELHRRLESVVIELSDLSREAGRLAASTEVDEIRLSELSQRRDAINRLLHKHRREDVAALLELQEELQGRLDGMKVSDSDIVALEAELSDLHSELMTKAKKISAKRLKAVAGLEGELVRILQSVGMPHASIELSHEIEAESFNSIGVDRFELLFSANKGVEVEPLKKVASGGERSRLMLAIKSIIARYMKLSTMIFDEIDTGISGEVAARVGSIFKSLSDHHQIISITHLPQIAARSTRHLFVYKDEDADITQARIKVLDADEKIVEIAKMLSGESPGEAAILTARELVDISVN